MDSLNKGINSINQKVNLISSFSYIYKNPEKKIEFPENRNKLMIDSGAFDLIIRENLDDFPFSPKEYADTIKGLDNKPNYVVSMDYICSPDDKDKNIDLVRKTVENAVLLRKEFKRGAKICFVPVVQGYYRDEYLFCIKELVNKKIVLNGDYIGIGSLAKRKRIKEAREIIKEIYYFLKKKKIYVNIHCFGLNLNIIKDKEIFNIISSIDSLAWTFPYRFGRVKMFTRDRMIEVNSNRKLKEPEFYYLSLDATLKYIDFLNFIYKQHQRGYSNSLNSLLFSKNYEEKFELLKAIAQRLGIHEFKINQIKQLEDLFHLIIKYNNTFPRSSELVIDRVPTYTGSKFLLLEPKNIKLSRLEFFYLLLTSIENAYKSNIDKKESGKKIFINLLKNIHNHLNETDLDIIKELLKDFKIESFYNTLFNPVDYNEIFYNFNTIISNIKNKIELKSYKIRNNCQLEQKHLTGKLINEEFFLLLEDLDFL